MQVLAFFLDAVRYNYINERDTPFLTSLVRKGVIAPLRTILGFTGIAATIFTGTYPEVHGVWTQYIKPDYSPCTKWLKPFGTILQTIDSHLLNMDRAEVRKAMRLGVFFLILLQLKVSDRSFLPDPFLDEVPFTLLPELDIGLTKAIHEASAFGNIKSLFDALRESDISFSVLESSIFRSDQRVLKRALRLAKHTNLSFILMKFSNLDTITHKYGVRSSQRVKELRRIDAYVKMIVSKFSASNKEYTVIVFSDHGMIDVHGKVNVIKELKKRDLEIQKNYFAFLDSTLARFWANESTLNRISEILYEIRGGRILSEKDLRTFHVPYGGMYGDLIFLANPGTIISPNFYQGDRFIASMHGYDPSVEGQDGVFLLSENVSESMVLDKVDLVDIMPTILKLLDIPSINSCAGKSIVI